MIQVPAKVVGIVVALILILLAACWSLSLRVYSGRRELAAYELGRLAERQQHPAILQMESGKPFCYDPDAGVFHTVRKDRKQRAFVVTK